MKSWILLVSRTNNIAKMDRPVSTVLFLFFPSKTKYYEMLHVDDKLILAFLEKTVQGPCDRALYSSSFRVLAPQGLPLHKSVSLFSPTKGVCSLHDGQNYRTHVELWCHIKYIQKMDRIDFSSPFSFHLVITLKVFLVFTTRGELCLWGCL